MHDSRLAEKEKKKKSAYLCGDGVGFAIESGRFRGLEIIKHHNWVTPRQWNLDGQENCLYQKKKNCDFRSLLKFTKYVTVVAVYSYFRTLTHRQQTWLGLESQLTHLLRCGQLALSHYWQLIIQISFTTPPPTQYLLYSIHCTLEVQYITCQRFSFWPPTRVALCYPLFNSTVAMVNSHLICLIQSFQWL